MNKASCNLYQVYIYQAVFYWQNACTSESTLGFAYASKETRI